MHWATWVGRKGPAAALVLAGVLGGCRNAHSGRSAADVQQYPIRGTVLQVDSGKGSLLLKHEAIPGFMEAMTMEYPVEDPAVLGEVHPGDRLSATLDADKGPDGPDHLRLRDVVVTGQAQPDYLPAVQYHVPAPGDAVPDFHFLNQSGKLVSLEQFRGRALLMTFIYTRCPLNDYCPRMSRNFAEVDKTLQADPRLYGKTHLLSVSFDPTFDTPAVLKSYGEAYTGRYTKETFAHWDFAAPTVTELSRVEQYFDLGVTARNGALQHSLATLVIGPDGKVVAFWPSNDWTPAQAVAELTKAVSGRAAASQ